MFTRHFGRIVRDKRERKRLTVARTAELAGLSEAGLTLIEMGDSNPKLSSITSLAAVLGEINDEFLEALKEETRKSQKDARGPPRSGAKFSISPTLESELDTVLNGTFDASKNEVYLGETSNFMTDIIGAEALSLYMPASKAYSSLVTEEEYNKKPYYSKQDNYHGIGKADFIEILEKSEEPILAFATAPDEDGNKRQNRIVLVTDKQILDLETGNYEYAVVVEEVDTTGWHKGKSMKANKTITIYPRSQLKQDVINAVIEHRILYTTKKGERLFAGMRGSNPQGAIQKDVLEKNIAYFWANVKWESEKNKTFSTKEPELPSEIRLALEKAGYFDQDGHNKYMQENEELSQEDASVDKSDDGQYSYSPENNIDNYTEEQYNDFGWASYSGTLITSQIDDLYSKIHEKRSLKNFPQSSRGEAIIAVNPHPQSTLEIDNTLVFVKGTKKAFSITKVLVIDLYSETDIFELEELIYEAEQKPWSRARSIVTSLFESELVREFRRRDFADYQEYTAEARQRSLGQEGSGNNRDNQQQSERRNDIGENKSDEVTQFSYTPLQDELSNREILADMLDSVAESDTAKRMLSRYKESLARVQENEAKIASLREEKKGASEAQKQAINVKIESLEKKISESEALLRKFEESATLRKLVEKERAKLADEAQAFNAIYNQGKQGKAFAAVRFGELLSPEQRQYAYQNGLVDGLMERGRNKNSSEVLQKGKKDAKINNNKESEENEQGIRLRDGGERDDGKDTKGQVSAVEGGTGQDQSRGKDQRRPRDREAASLTYGEEVSAKSRGIKGGLDSGKVYLLAEGSETNEMKKARARAEKLGKKVTFFAGGNLRIEQGDVVISARAYIEGDNVYVRVDHPYYTADQLMRHELGHDMIARGEVDINEVRERINDRFVDVDFVIEQYTKAYEGSGLDAAEIWEEIICDSLGDMNAFASVEVLGEINDVFLEELKEEIYKSRKDARGPPSAVGRASRESRAKGADYLTRHFSGKINVDYSEIYVSDEELGIISSSVKTGYGALNKQKTIGRVHTSKKYYVFSFEVGGAITIRNAFDQETDAEIISYIEESIKNDRVRARTFQTFDRWFDSVRNGEGRDEVYSRNAIQQTEENGSIDGLDGRSSQSNTGRHIESRVGNVQQKDNIGTHLPISRIFTDISGRKRKVLGISNGQYMVQDTKKVNYRFNSIEEAISAENENIIQRYARKNNRTVTWVKEKLAADSNFLVKERRKGKASQDLDFIDFLNENAEERELSSREILANMLDSVAESDTAKRMLSRYKESLARVQENEAKIASLREEKKGASKAQKQAINVKIDSLEKKISESEALLRNFEESATLRKLVEKERAKLADFLSKP